MRILILSRYTTDRRSATVVHELNKIKDVEVFNLTWGDHPELHPLRNMFSCGLDTFDFPQFTCHFDRPNTADPIALEMCLKEFRPHVTIITSEVYEKGTHEQIDLCQKYGSKVALVAWQNTMPDHKEKDPIIRNYIKKTFEMSDMILVGSTYARKWHEKFGEANFVVVPFLAVKQGIFFPMKKKDFIREETKKMRDEWKNKFVVSYIGRFLEWKGIVFMAEAMDKLMTENEDMCFFAVGKGFDDDAPIDKQAQIKLNYFVTKWGARAKIFPYAKTGDHLNEYFNCSDIYLYPSLPKYGRIIEQFGVMMPDSGLAGVPCIGPTIGGSMDIIAHKETGYLVEPGSSEAIIEAIKMYRALTNDEKILMKEKAVELNQQWLGHNIAKKIVNSLKKIIK